MARILGISFDFDGSLSRDLPDSIIYSNIDLLIHIKEKMENFNLTYTFVGSNRQSDIDDNMNAVRNDTGSCYPLIRLVTNFIDAIFDDSLLADFYNDLLPGESMRRAIALQIPHSDNTERFDYHHEQLKQSPPIDWLHDRSKLSIIVTQIQKLASEHPDDEIEFEFYDDNVAIIEALHAYFSVPENCQLLPKNLKAFRLAVYPPQQLKDGEDLVPGFYPPIAGAGEIDFNYRHTLKRMAAACIESPNYQAYEPVAKHTRVTNYSHVEYAGFTLTAPMDFVRDYKPGMVPAMEPQPIPHKLKMYTDIFHAPMPSQAVPLDSPRAPNPASSSTTLPSTSSRFFSALSTFIPRSSSFKLRKRSEDKRKSNSSDSNMSITDIPTHQIIPPKLRGSDLHIAESNSTQETDIVPFMETKQLIEREGVDSKTEEHHSFSNSSYDTPPNQEEFREKDKDDSNSDTPGWQGNFFQPSTKYRREQGPVTLSTCRTNSYTN